MEQTAMIRVFLASAGIALLPLAAAVPAVDKGTDSNMNFTGFSSVRVVVLHTTPGFTPHPAPTGSDPREL